MPKKVRTHPGPFLIHAELMREWIEDDQQFPYMMPVVRGLGKLKFHPKVTFLIGENGTGKSTILEAVAVAYGLNPEGGSLNLQFATKETHSQLHKSLRLARTPAMPYDSFFLRAESFYNVATAIEEVGMLDPYGGKSLHIQSHGESYFTLFEQRFRRNSLYFMDEPEAALSPSRQLQFLRILHDYLQAGCQFVIATHSPIIMAYPDACIYQFTQEGIEEVQYKETEHYLITRSFLNNSAKALEVLFSEEE